MSQIRPNIPNVIDCRKFHSNCTKTITDKLIDALKYTVKIYTIAHGAPLFIFKFKQILKSPIPTLIKLIDNVIRSMGFLSGYIVSIKLFHCFIHYRIFGKLHLINLLLQSFVNTSLVLFEDTKRIEEYAIFTFPRVIEGIWYFIKKNTKLNDINNGIRLIFALCAGIAFVLKKHFPNETPSNYVKQFSFIFGEMSSEASNINNSNNNNKSDNNNTELKVDL